MCPASSDSARSRADADTGRSSGGTWLMRSACDASSNDAGSERRGGSAASPCSASAATRPALASRSSYRPGHGAYQSHTSAAAMSSTPAARPASRNPSVDGA